MKQGSKEGSPEKTLVIEGATTGSESVKIWHWNVNGIRAVLNSGKFQEFVKKGKFI